MPLYTAVTRSVRRGLNNLDDHNVLEAIDLFRDLAHFIKRVVCLAVVVVTIGRKQNLGFDLTEAIHHPLKTKVRRARRPHSAQTGCGQHSHHRLGHIGHKTCNAVAGLNAARLQSSRYCSYLRV